MTSELEIVGLIPAAGQATRLAPLPCSKELFPIGWRTDETGLMKPKVVSHYLLDKYKAAGIRKCYFILRKGKWDIPQYYGDGEMVDMDLAYLMMKHPHGHPFTLDQAYPFTSDKLVAFGYPDILFSPEDAFSQLIKKQSSTKASVVLGIFPISSEQRWTDILAFGKNGKIETISLEDPSTAGQRVGWSIALWTPEFAKFMHEFLEDAIRKERLLAPDGKEFTLNHIFQGALDKGMSMDYVVFNSGYVLDVGTAGDLVNAQQEQLNSAKLQAKKKG